MAYPAYTSSTPPNSDEMSVLANEAVPVDVSWIIDLATLYLEAALVALAVTVVGWLASKLSRWIDLEIDRDHSDALHAAISRGVRHAISVVRKETKHHATIDIESQLIAETAIYMKELMPGALRYFRLTDTALDRLIRAHLGPDILHWLEKPRVSNADGAAEVTR